MVLAVFLVSFWCYDSGWRHLGGFILILAFGSAVAAAMWTVRELIRWLADAVRRIRGLEEKR
jgi:hypothetical protein